MKMINKRSIILIFISLFLINIVSALQIGPVKVEGNFKPNFETTINYKVSTYLDREIEIYAEGDLAEYVTFNTTKIYKTGTVVATLKLPESIEPPGKKIIWVAAREIPEGNSVMAITVAVRAAIIIFVPYPGKYLETSLGVGNVNVGEPIDVRLIAISRGDEDLIMNPRIEIYTEYDELIETLDFMERELKSGEKVELKKTSNKTYGAGRYYAISKINYGDRVAIDNSSFRVGELTINIANYSEEIIIGGLQPFWVGLESGWNDVIDGAFADITIFNSTRKFAEFRTSPTNLDPFEFEWIKGYFDTTNLTEGTYKAKIDVTYYGRDRGKSTSKTVEFDLVEEEEESNLMDILLIVGIIFLGGIILLIILIVIVMVVKNGKKRKK